jgi:hypothetical protein
VKYYVWDKETDEVRETDQSTWMSQLGDIDARRVGWTVVNGHRVSTVFLGNDHRWLGDGPPLLFETMVFPGVDEDETWVETYCDRYSTPEQARAGHARVVAVIAAVQDPEVTE